MHFSTLVHVDADGCVKVYIKIAIIIFYWLQTAVFFSLPLLSFLLNLFLFFNNQTFKNISSIIRKDPNSQGAACHFYMCDRERSYMKWQTNKGVIYRIENWEARYADLICRASTMLCIRSFHKYRMEITLTNWLTCYLLLI